MPMFPIFIHSPKMRNTREKPKVRDINRLSVLVGNPPGISQTEWTEALNTKKIMTLAAAE